MSDDERANAAELRRQVFGGGDDDSDLSDEEQQPKAPRQPSRSASPYNARQSPSRSRSRSRSQHSQSHSPARSASPSVAQDQDGDHHQQSDGEDGAGGSDYEEKEKRLSFKKKAAAKERKGDDGEGSEKRKKKRKAPAQADASEDEAPVEETPEMAARARVNARIDAVVKNPKSKSRKKARKGEEDDLEQMADDLIQNLKEKMMAAAQKDEEAVLAKRPATAKLMMLKEVMGVLQQSTMSQSIVDNDLLSAVKRWLDPLPDKSLPALDIQNSFFDILVKMDIETHALKSSQLGKVILFYTKSKRSTTHIKRQADRLLAAWSRPIIKRSSSFRTKLVPTVSLSDRTRERMEDERMGREEERERTGGVGHGNVVHGGRKGDGDANRGRGGMDRKDQKDKKRRNVRIPAADNMTFTVAPAYSQSQSQNPHGGGSHSQSQSQGGGGSQSQGVNAGEVSKDQERRKREADRLKKVKKQLNEARKGERL